ncbi:MAG: helix-turn-helix domain-containing protein [Pseudonocardiaceae bacterium]
MTSFQREREALGQRLRGLRQDARLTGRQLAESQRWQPSKVSRIESGKQTPSDADVEAWAVACGVPAAVGDLIASLRTLEGHYLEHRRAFRAGMAHFQRTIRDQEAQYSVIRNFQCSIIPGLLQTPEYARHRFTPGVKYGGLPTDIDDSVAARMARQQILYRPETRAHFVLTEAPLRYRPCPPEVLEGQLDRLLGLASMRTVRLGVIPFETQLGNAPLHGFAIHDESRVRVETLTATLTLSEPSEIRDYLELFAEYANLAVYGGEARAVITRTLSELAESHE